MKKREAGIIATGISVMGLMLTGCGLSGPTYGTDKNQAQQLMDDISNIASIKPDRRNEGISTTPRPTLVQPGPGFKKSLPKPQENVAQAGSPDWPESPEQRRKRLRDDATANQGNPNYVSPIVSGKTTDANGSSSSDWLNGIHRDENSRMSPKAQREEYLRRKKENNGGTADNRKYLSEPPLIYREPSASAPVGDQGEDEAKKERERKKAMKSSSSKSSWWPF